jgi:hypothetical protein
MKLIRALRRQSRNHSMIEVYVNQQLDELPMMSPSADFTERVMSELGLQAENGDQETHEKKPFQASRWRRATHAELTNGLIASAATYFFVASGMLGRLVSLDVEQISLRLASTVFEAVWIGQGAVHEFSQWINQVL